jgi:hypothetical protein
MQRRAVLVIGIVALVGVISTVTILLTFGDHPERRPAPPGNAQASDVAAALRRLSTDPASLVADGAEGELGGRARQAVPVGSAIVVHERSWTPDGAGGGLMTVTVTPPGRARQTYAAVMVHQDNGWKVLATIPVTAAVRPSASPS